MEYKKITLPSGLRVLLVPLKNNQTVTVSVLVSAGSNHEKEERNGVAHFLEHMCFKGTKKRNNKDIAFELTSLGAEFNAFTSNEYTGYYAKAEKKHFAKIVDVLSDIYLNSVFDDKEIQKERGVIIEEYNMYQDLPQRQVIYNLLELMYPNTPAGRNIIGSKETINSIQRNDFIKFKNKYYNAKNTLVVVSGGIDTQKTVDLIKRSFKDISKKTSSTNMKIVEKQSKPAVKLFTKKTDQAHFILAFRAFSLYDKRAWALNVLSSILGSGMSSRLFHEMRDNRGMCYYVRSNTVLERTYGLFAISSGVKIDRTEEAVTLILEEIKRLKTELVPEDELKKAKAYTSGSLVMGVERSDDYAEFYGFQELAKDKILSVKEQIKKIEAVTARDIKKLANEIFTDKGLNLSIVGPQEDGSKFERLLKI